MTVTNHTLAGAVIALTVKEPVLALPLSLLSHFILDALPHFGMNSFAERRNHPKLFKGSLVLDSIIFLVVLFLLWQHDTPGLVYLCSLLAISPDFVWWYRFLVIEKFGTKPPPPMSGFNKWHSAIQTRESLWPGLAIEIGIMICFAIIVSQLL